MIVAGTAPEYGIDFEPNADCTVNVIAVSNTEIYNCKGGIMAGIKGEMRKMLWWATLLFPNVIYMIFEQKILFVGIIAVILL